jgi:tetratricopeptide (TPR) repeat protein
MTMVELIKGLASVRDGLTLIAFLSLVLLLAFRTKKVPELVFGLVRDKLTRQQFYALLHRFMILAFAAFLALVLLTIASQVLSRLTQPGALSLADLRSELAKIKAPEDEKTHAVAQYRLANDQLNQRNFDEAIAALKASITAVPTLTAQELLINLNRQKGDFTSAAAAWEGAAKLARERDDKLALVRLDMTGVPDMLPQAEGEHDLIGPSTAFPKGGTEYESALTLAPGFYKCVEACSGWFKLDLRTGDRLDSRPYHGAAQLSLYGTNGQHLKTEGTDCCGAGSLYRLEWVAAVSGWHFLQTNAAPDAVYRVQVR